MIIQFIKLRLLETSRSSVWNKNVLINILFGFFMLYMAACFIVIGLLLDRILLEAAPESDPVDLFNRVLLYYFGLELLVRFLMQATPAMSITPFLHLPVRRSFLMHFLLMRSMVNPLNYIAFLIFIPFAVKAVSAIYLGAAACWWLLALFLLVLFVIYINVYIKRQMVVKPIVSLGCGLAYIALITLDIVGVFSLSAISATLFNAVIDQPLWIVIPALMAGGAYLLNYRFLKIHSYPEEIDRTSSKKQVSVQRFDFMSRFGIIGELIAVEMKLILRHKRTKSLLSITPLFLFYGLLFYSIPVYTNNMMWMMFCGIVITGWMMVCYGQFIVAWEGKFFDGILTRESSLSDYLRAKYYLLVSFCVISYVLTIPYVYFGMWFLWLQTACFLFNIGVSTCVILWFAQYNRKRIELAQGTAFNWQGSSAAQFIVMLPILLLPMLVASIFKWIGWGDWGLSVLALLGLIGVLCHKWLLEFICRCFEKTKYALAEGFRTN